MTVLICGSLAFDTVMVFDGRFKEHILPDRIHMLSVSFLVPQLRRNYGGVAGNIAYNLKLLGQDSVVLATVGDDFEPYARWMTQKGLSTQYVKVIPETYTAQAFITTDLDDNQITAFHPGAMQYAGTLSVPTDAGITLGLVGPDSREAMLQHAGQFHAAGIPFVFDPGQGLPMFDGADLLAFIEQAAWVIVNDYEGQLLQERTGLSPPESAAKCRAYVVTQGGQGSTVYLKDETLQIPSVTPAKIVDPTGCGDAYRAGILYGLTHGFNWATTGRLASLMGAIKIAHHGTQAHQYAQKDIADQFAAAFGYPLQ